MTSDLPDVPRWQDTPVVTPTPEVRDAPTPLLAQAHLAALTATAGQIIPPLARAVGWLRWPSLVVLVLGAAGPVLLIALAASWQGWPRPVGIVVGLLALVPVVLLGRSRAATLRAARAPEALTAELAGFAAHVNGGLAILDKLRAVAQGGGARLIPRLTALWKVVQLPGDALEHLDRLPHLRWFLPPRVTDTWARVITVVWSSLGCYLLSTFLGALSLTDVL
ncbi:hypothetical protein C8046_00095 [Serinibacter arcticus]|uniref:Uncharacterized protein n=1 Tax=Serinibacter arcticus TaxID=1655435 RepID=A0A2U1ZQZ2_9MICO|nr:hypothetical protein [Serinibacter arcticus]PWD49361.1 hypothetical protein C8046_00095 [Serinibacter arcticus]